ncbi:uncharacterized protein LOC134542313 isoform X2 [Bacillus rossius redtenbacheri]|uniref:uncharacterized protein LOC134542313 isoform X2 n=1 Tax=Bacillus rossius redtenbacheri TaxID=93214 RepID=UPI002FDD07FC
MSQISSLVVIFSALSSDPVEDGEDRDPMEEPLTDGWWFGPPVTSVNFFMKALRFAAEEEALLREFSRIDTDSVHDESSEDECQNESLPEKVVPSAQPPAARRAPRAGRSEEAVCRSAGAGGKDVCAEAGSPGCAPSEEHDGERPFENDGAWGFRHQHEELTSQNKSSCEFPHITIILVLSKLFQMYLNSDYVF